MAMIFCLWLCFMVQPLYTLYLLALLILLHCGIINLVYQQSQCVQDLLSSRDVGYQTALKTGFFREATLGNRTVQAQRQDSSCGWARPIVAGS